MMISLYEIPNIPKIKKNDDIGMILCEKIKESNLKLEEGDIICVASKIISISENRVVNFTNVIPSDLALKINKLVPRKDERIIQLMLEETKDLTGDRLDIDENYIGGWLPNGLKLTSAGIDRVNQNEVILLPENPDISAKEIGEKIYEIFKVNVGVIITDSDGREDKIGATQIAIGLYGVPALRISKNIDSISGIEKKNYETLCDLIAASSALIMGQRGTNKPAIILKGLSYVFDKGNNIKDALCKSKEK